MGNNLEEKVAELVVSGEVSLQAVYGVLVEKNPVFIYDIIDKEIRMAKEKGLDADTVYSGLNCKYSSELFQDALKVYIDVNNYVDKIITYEGLTFSSVYDHEYDYEYAYYMSNKDLVNHELKNRGFEGVCIITSPASDDINHIINISAGIDWMDTYIWQEYFDNKCSEIADDFDFIVEQALYDEDGIQEDIDLEELKQYWDIFKALNSDDSINKEKHELDICFANKAISGEVIYLTDEIVTEINRLYTYFYDGYQEAFDRIEAVLNAEYSCSIKDFDSWDYLKDNTVDFRMDDWLSYECWREVDVTKYSF